MSRRALVGLALISLLTAFTWPTHAQSFEGTIDRAIDWLRAQQMPDGGFGGGFGAGSDTGGTCDVILAAASAGVDPSGWVSAEGNTPLDYLQTAMANGEEEPINVRAKVALALLATQQDPRDFANRDLIAELESGYDPATGSYGGNLFDQGLVIVTLFNAGELVPEGASQYLLDHQTDDGAWALFGDTSAGTGDTNTTAMAIQALLATGRRDDIGEAFAYLHRVQNEDGGFPYQSPSPYGTESDANSTAYVLQALLAANEPLGDWAPAGTDPLGALLRFQDPTSGGFYWQTAVPSPNLMATAQAVPAIAGYTFLNLPTVAVGAGPAPVSRSDVALLPESGAQVLLPAGLIAVGAVVVALGLVLSRRGRGA